MTGKDSYRVLNLSALDVEGIKKLTTEPFTIERPKSEPGRHNELATLAIVGAIGVVSAAAGYYFGKRKTEDVELYVEAINADGSARRVALRIARSETEPVDIAAKIAKQLEQIG